MIAYFLFCYFICVLVFFNGLLFLRIVLLLILDWGNTKGLPTPSFVLGRMVQATIRPHYTAGEMLSGRKLGGLITAATIQGGKTENQDSFWYGSFATCNAIVIADGVSSSTYAQIAATTMTRCFAQTIESAARVPGHSFDQNFFHTLCHEAALRIAREVPEGQSADTTFIALLELSDRYVLAHLGDGGIVRFRGNRRDGKSMLLAHHDIFGRLIGFVGAAGVSGKPTVIELSKFDFSDGDALLIGTDGALPPRKETGHAFNILEELSKQSWSWDGNMTSAQTAHVIAQYLENCNPDDNATIGILFTQKALDYWKQNGTTIAKISQGEK